MYISVSLSLLYIEMKMQKIEEKEKDRKSTCNGYTKCCRIARQSALSEHPLNAVNAVATSIVSLMYTNTFTALVVS